MKLGNNFTRVKLFPNFTRHHLITHTYLTPESRLVISRSRFTESSFNNDANFGTFIP